MLLFANIKRRPGVVGLAGPPGSGKTTTANALACVLQHAYGLSTDRVSLEDFYLPSDERERRGFTWRAIPGSHDLEALIACIDRFRQGHQPLWIPRFDVVHDCPLPPDCRRNLDLIILEGWLVGTQMEGYAELRPLIDMLIYLDVDHATARRGRFARENRALQFLQAGLSDADMERFWVDVLGPGIHAWTEPIRCQADIVVKLDSARRVDSITRRSGPA
jgi:pantothenate kinase-related protein Tda10